jgi:hypothetical protein
MREYEAAERAGTAAKTAARLRRERGRVAGWAAAVLCGIPLLFAAVWVRHEIGEALRARDELLAERERIDHSLLTLEGERTKLSTWGVIGERATRLGLRPPRASEVVWVRVREMKPGAG